MMQRCPITGQLIPAEDMSNHLKVLLLDPKWKQQKDALVERARKESAFADDVEANLASFVAKRPDLFGSVDEQIREAAEAGAEAAARDAGADAGPAHTMVPPTAQGAAGGRTNAPQLPAPASSSQPALPGAVGQQAIGPITGVSTINARLPGASVNPPTMAPPLGLPGSRPPGMAPAVQDDDDDDDEPSAKKPRLDDGSLQPESKWMEKYPLNIQIIVSVNLGADAHAAGIPTMIPMEVPVGQRVLDFKQKLAPKVQAAGITVNAMKLKVQPAGYILKNSNTLAFYNIAPGNLIELSRKQRGGAK
jgi:hypothetical protein